MMQLMQIPNLTLEFEHLTPLRVAVEIAYNITSKYIESILDSGDKAFSLAGLHTIGIERTFYNATLLSKWCFII